MSFSSVSGKNWLFKKFDLSDVTKFSESYALTEIVAKLLSIRKKNIDDINLFLDPKIKNFLPNPIENFFAVCPSIPQVFRYSMAFLDLLKLSI